MTPPPDDAVAALLAELQESPLPGARYAYTVVKRHAAGWTLVRRSEQEALVADAKRLRGALRDITPDDPASYVTGTAYCRFCGSYKSRGHSDDCPWVKARAALASPATEEVER